MAAETDDRSTPVFEWAASPSSLESLHLPDIGVSGSRLLRMVYSSGWVYDPWQGTYLIETNEDDPRAVLRFEIKVYGRDKVVTGKRELTVSELVKFRTAFAKLNICSTAGDGEDVMDAPEVHFEFADKARYCFASRSFYDENDPEFSELVDVITSFLGAKGPGN